MVDATPEGTLPTVTEVKIDGGLVVVSITETALEVCRATYARVPSGMKATATGAPVSGPMVAETAGGLTAVLITETVFAPELHT
jgi:hypothetical protein